ncbi:MAG: hypothetical protein LIO58_09605 [Oscillospiraceae bacterium]|nr:hypothetical protein [Oscillospiraceae bacterium]
METTQRKKLVASLLSASKRVAKKEAEIIRAEEDLSPDFIYTHLKTYIFSKFMLSDACAEENLMELASLSLQRTMKLDRKMIRELDQAAPCDHATSESTKKVLLLYAIQQDLGIRPNPVDLTTAETVRTLASVVYNALIDARQEGDV